MPQNPDLIIGKVYSTRGTCHNSVVIINSDIKTTTNSSGQYILDLANLQDGYTVGTAYSIVAYDEYDNEYTSSTITSTGTGQTKDLYLDSRVKTNESRVSGILTPVSIRGVGDMPTTTDNPLPVVNIERPLTQKISYSGNYAEYIGEASPGTPTSIAKWRIKKLEYSGSMVTGTIWANGSSNFEFIWDNKTDYNYS